MQKIIAMIPTYNEKENIPLITEQILALNIPNLEIIIVDDNSPDNTAKAVNQAHKKHPQINLLLRKKDKGRGYAGRAGFIYALEHNADIIIEMDADLSHDPQYIPEMINLIKQGYDLIIGSRIIKGGKDAERGFFRKIITILANNYIKILLGIKVKDCNSGYRCFTRKAMQSINPYKLKSKDADIVQEVLYKANLKKLKIKEMPIEFKERIKGETTKTLKDYIKGLYIVLKLRIAHLIGEF